MPHDPFQTLGLPPTVELTQAQIRSAWLKRSLIAHPDRSDIDETAARELSATLNEAKKQLENEESRADALLLHLGGPTREAEKKLPDNFLIEIMQLREQLESAQAAADPAALEPSRARALKERQARLNRVREMFTALNVADHASLRAIRIELNAWRYLERMLEQIDPAVR